MYLNEIELHLFIYLYKCIYTYIRILYIYIYNAFCPFSQMELISILGTRYHSIFLSHLPVGLQRDPTLQLFSLSLFASLPIIY
jgi:hypothetical protein